MPAVVGLAKTSFQKIGDPVGKERVLVLLVK
jgi:hypothetical protein